MNKWWISSSQLWGVASLVGSRWQSLAGKRQVLLGGMEEHQWVVVSSGVVVATIRKRWGRQVVNETKGHDWV